jgi:hypothetical protein
MHRARLIAALLLAAAAAPLAAQQSSDSVPVMERRELDGPRVGFTYITGPKADARLHELNLKPLMSLFGWHFEQVSRPRNGGPMLVAQQIFLIAGLDQGIAIPSGSLLVGIRLQNGFEFGMGPNLSPVGAALAMGFGKSLRMGGATIPLNVALVMSQGAMRTSFLAGYAIRHR